MKLLRWNRWLDRHNKIDLAWHSLQVFGIVVIVYAGGYWWWLLVPFLLLGINRAWHAARTY